MRKRLPKFRCLPQPSFPSDLLHDLFQRLLHSTHKDTRGGSKCKNYTGAIIEYATCNYSTDLILARYNAFAFEARLHMEVNVVECEGKHVPSRKRTQTCACGGERVCMHRWMRVHAEANAFAVENKCTSAREGERTHLHDKTYMYSTCIHLKEAKGNARALVHIYNTCRCLCIVKLTSNFQCLTPEYTYVMSKRSYVKTEFTHSPEANVFTGSNKCTFARRRKRVHSRR